MSDQTPSMADSDVPAVRRARGGRWVTLVAGAVVLLLALGAVLWPRGADRHQAHTLLVFDPSGSQERMVGFFVPLRKYLAAAGGGSLELVRVRTLSAFTSRLAARPDFIFAPDGLAIAIPAESYLPLVVGRRSAPRNLRPRGVLVFRRTVVAEPEPWRTQPAATVFGDSVSLAATGVLRRAGLGPWPQGVVCGPDPYDHGPVLHALRMGAFDFAVVRQWDAERFFDDGLLDPEHFAIRELVGPVPDAVLMVSRQVPQRVRLRCGEGLSGLGRQQADEGSLGRALRQGLTGLHLAGFNLLLEPDFDLVRKNYPAGWLSGFE